MSEAPLTIEEIGEIMDYARLHADELKAFSSLPTATPRRTLEFVRTKKKETQ